jgi:predicted LPLAT superfamily acyltransferase
MKTGRTKYSFYATEAKVYDNLPQMMADYSVSLENVMKKFPLQWFNYHSFWKIQQ